MNDIAEALVTLGEKFRELAPEVESWSLRLVEEGSEVLTMRQGILEPPVNRYHRGALISVVEKGGGGYAATSNLSLPALFRSFAKARRWAEVSSTAGLVKTAVTAQGKNRFYHETIAAEPWEAVALEDKVILLRQASRALKTDQRIVDWSARLGFRTVHSVFLGSQGSLIVQTFHFLSPGLRAVANEGLNTQVRSSGFGSEDRQGGMEQLVSVGFPERAERVAAEVVELLNAPECPQESMDLLLLPSQMALQIHESIGHPLELDRILGDERNYAGTSFVNLEMFGNYRYGSDLLNVTFDPRVPSELAGYAYDDEGNRAEKAYLIRRGRLERPLGGALSQARAGLPGVANARSCAWNRPPIDRMANLNLEAGRSSFSDLLTGIGRGILMDGNRSWSIDDSRNKFQFGCELGRLIENGELGQVVRNPNYRGVSASFWRNLVGVGDVSTFRIHGVPNCGKGEPNQLIHVGHASPACVFRNVEVFGGGD